MPGEVPPTRLTALARRLVVLVTERTRAELAAAGFADVRPVHHVVLAQARGAGARITDMAERSGITKQAVTLMVDHLEGGGYVARAADPDDRRAKRVVLTERGEAAAGASLRAVEAVERGFSRELGVGPFAEVKRSLSALVAALEDDRPAGPGFAPVAPGGEGATG